MSNEFSIFIVGIATGWVLGIFFFVWMGRSGNLTKDTLALWEQRRVWRDGKPGDCK